MALSSTTDFGTVYIPGAYPTIAVQPSVSGLSTTGVLMLVGEADQGPDYSLEADLNQNGYGPDQAGDVTNKYKSGPLVDAFKAACDAANDPQIQGAFARIIMVKTNPSTKATSSILKFTGGAYATLQDKSYGKLGNLISRVITTKTAEVIPTTGSFLFLPPIAATDVGVRVNGGTIATITVAANTLPAAFATQMDGIAGVDVAAGSGVDRGVLASATGTLALTVVSGNNVTITRSVNWSVAPSVGDTLYIPASTALSTSQATNAGAYVVTSVSAASLNATKLLNITGSPTVITAPVNQTAVSSASTTDVRCFAPVTVSLVAGNPTDGIGKSLSIADMATNTGLLAYLCYTYSVGGGALPVTWIASGTSPTSILTSATEYCPTLTNARQLDNLTEDLSAGGNIGLKIGYSGSSATASVVITATTMTITVTGGTGTSPTPITLSALPSIADLATYINTLTGFACAVGSTAAGQMPTTTLDQGTFTFGTTFGGYGGFIKQDAYRFYTKVTNESILVSMAAPATAGVPAPAAIAYLAGGTKGSTTDAIFNAAVDALQYCRGNFLVPLFSRDATSDIADSLTESSSSYTIANIHSYCRSHVLQMSTMKRKRNRQAFLSIRSTFATCKSTSANIASYRCSMTFMDVKDNGANGIVQFQPYMGAIKAAAMQAAGFYRGIVRKGISISGALQAAGDFNPNNDSQVEDALIAGLLPIRQAETGGFYWVSDQTTYGKDSNFVFNSIQATYVADVIALTIASRMEDAFAGQSIADVGASMAMQTLEAIMEDLKRLKLIAPSDDAPKGYKDASVKIVGPTMRVSIGVKLAGLIYFIPIFVSVSEVTQSA